MARQEANDPEMLREIEELLRQTRRRGEFESAGLGPWTVVYFNWHLDETNGARYAAWTPKNRRSEVLSDDTWDLGIGEGLPGFTQSWDAKNRKRTTYMRYGNLEGIEPLVIIQNHHGSRPEMLPQLAEEFRLYHNLWSTSDLRKLYKLKNDGLEELVAEISEDEVRVRTKYLRQFQAGRQLDLSLFLDSIQFVDDPDQSIDLDSITEETHDNIMRLSLYASDHIHGPGRPFSRLLGKRLLLAPSRSQAGIWPFEKTGETFHEFIIGEDVDGNAIKNTSDPDKLANYFGKNPNAPHYLTPVFFRRDVLKRYYENPGKYSVEDGYLRCVGLWGVRLDNDHPEHVMVFLGDLGRDLPESERPYWQTFNVPPAGSMSRTVYLRSFEGQFTDPTAPDLRFKSAYERFRRKWSDALGWDLFREPEEDDLHVFQRLRIPLDDSQPEFEAQVLGLAKVMIDWLDEAGIVAQLGSKVRDEKGISKLERFLTDRSYDHIERDIRFMRRLQHLRSVMSAHGKGSQYKRALDEEGVDENTIVEVARMFHHARTMLVDVASHFGVDLETY